MTKAVLLTDGQSYLRVLKRDDDCGFECVTHDGELQYVSEANLGSQTPVLVDEIVKASGDRVYFVVRGDGMADWYVNGRYFAPVPRKGRYER